MRMDGAHDVWKKWPGSTERDMVDDDDDVELVTPRYVVHLYISFTYSIKSFNNNG